MKQPRDYRNAAVYASSMMAEQNALMERVFPILEGRDPMVIAGLACDLIALALQHIEMPGDAVSTQRARERLLQRLINHIRDKLRDR